MDSIRVKHSEVIGKSQSKTAVLESRIKTNALNWTGNVNYNEFGKLDGIGFEKVSVKFVDSFIFFVLVPDDNTEKKKKIIGSNVGFQNTLIFNKIHWFLLKIDESSLRRWVPHTYLK